MSDATALTVVQRASVALGASDIENKLIELAKQSTEIVKITNSAGREQCHSALMVLKGERVAIEKLGKAARDDATKFSKAVIAEEDRLIKLISPEEKRLQEIRDAWDAVREAEKQAKIKAEMERVAAIRKQIGFIHEEVLYLSGKHSAAIEERLSRLKAEIPNKENYEEFLVEAETAHTQAVQKIETLLEVTRARELEDVRLKAERAELELLRAKHQALEAEALQQRAAENARIDAERKAEEAKIKATRDAEEGRLAAVRKADQDLRDAEDKRLKAERDELERERAAIQAEKAREAKAVSDAKEAEEKKVKEQQAELARQQALIDKQKNEQERIEQVKAEREKALRDARSQSPLADILDICSSYYPHQSAEEAITRISIIAEANISGVPDDAHNPEWLPSY